MKMQVKSHFERNWQDFLGHAATIGVANDLLQYHDVLPEIYCTSKKILFLLTEFN